MDSASPFSIACKEKFERGKREHNQPWDNEHINVAEEIRGECCDLANYSTLLISNENLAMEIRIIAEEIFNRMEKMK